MDSGTALLVQTAGPEQLALAVDRVRERFPGTRLTVLLQRKMGGLIPPRPEVEYVENEGPRPGFVRRLRTRKFDTVFVLYTNEPGYWKLKLLPFVMGARSIFAINENLDWFPVSLRHGSTLARHLRWRLGHPGGGLASDLERLGRAAAYPAVLGWLLAYERVQGLRARMRGAPPTWKRENRPGAAS
jgi:hypothetical protein